MLPHKRKANKNFPIKYSRITNECFSFFPDKIDRGPPHAKHPPNKDHNVQPVIFF